MPLKFDGQHPFRMDHCVYIYGRDGAKEVLCQIFTKTLKQMHAGPDADPDADPLEVFAHHRRKIEKIFSSLYDLGLFDEKGEITFSTEPHDCPLPTAVPPAL
jgi:hypothetical protein